MNHEHEHYYGSRCSHKFWLVRSGFVFALLVALIGVYFVTGHLKHAYQVILGLIFGDCLLTHSLKHHDQCRRGPAFIPICDNSTLHYE